MRSMPREALGLAFSTLVVGAALFALPPFGAAPLPHQVSFAAALLVLWSFTDGTVGRLHWGLAVIEGLLRLRVSLSWVALLIEVFSRPAG